MTLRSPLHDVHERLGARFVDFGGWSMPVHYASVITEHMAVRSSAGWFDVSHLGRFSWAGPGAAHAVRRLLCNDIERIEPGRTQYSMLLNDDGGVVDDLVVWRWNADDLWILPNAANHERVMRAFADEAPDVTLRDLRPETVTVAVQGPDAPAALETVLGSAPRRFRTAMGNFEGLTYHAAGTGYTGERGGEVTLPAGSAEAFVEALVDAGVQPCGLAARDTLRLEAGLPLWGQDLDETITPLEAGLEFAVAFDHEFPGREALLRRRDAGVDRSRVAFRTPGREIPRHGQRLRAPGDDGIVTSGNFSPVLERGIGLGLLSGGSPEDLEVDIRGRWIPCEVVETPFV